MSSLALVMVEERVPAVVMMTLIYSHDLFKLALFGQATSGEEALQGYWPSARSDKIHKGKYRYSQIFTQPDVLEKNCKTFR